MDNYPQRVVVLRDARGDVRPAERHPGRDRALRRARRPARSVHPRLPRRRRVGGDGGGVGDRGGCLRLGQRRRRFRDVVENVVELRQSRLRRARGDAREDVPPPRRPGRPPRETRRRRRRRRRARRARRGRGRGRRRRRARGGGGVALEPPPRPPRPRRRRRVPGRLRQRVRRRRRQRRGVRRGRPPPDRGRRRVPGRRAVPSPRGVRRRASAGAERRARDERLAVFCSSRRRRARAAARPVSRRRSPSARCTSRRRPR